MGFYYTSGLDWAIIEEIRLYPFHFLSAGQYFSSAQGQGEGAEDQSRAMRGGGTGAHRARRTLASDLHRSKEARVRQTLPGNVRNASQKTGTGLWKTARAEDSLPPANQGWERSGPGPETAPSSSHLSI